MKDFEKFLRVFHWRLMFHRRTVFFIGKCFIGEKYELILRMIRALSKTTTGKISAPRYSPKGEKSQQFRRAPEGMRTEEMTDFLRSSRVFWGRILVPSNAKWPMKGR